MHMALHVHKPHIAMCHSHIPNIYHVQHAGTFGVFYPANVRMPNFPVVFFVVLVLAKAAARLIKLCLCL